MNGISIINKIMVVILTVIMVLAASFCNVNAACSSWTTYYKSSTYCQSPDCGPGGVKETKYQDLKQERYCKYKGGQKRETRPVQKKLGCC